jgi:hypothetical protein
MVHEIEHRERARARLLRLRAALELGASPDLLDQPCSVAAPPYLSCIVSRWLRRPVLRTGASMCVLSTRRRHVVCGMRLCRSGVFSGFTTKVVGRRAGHHANPPKTRVFAPSPAAAHVHPRLPHPYHRLRDNARARCDRLPVSAVVCGPSLCRSGVFSFFG